MGPVSLLFPRSSSHSSESLPTHSPAPVYPSSTRRPCPACPLPSERCQSPLTHAVLSYERCTSVPREFTRDYEKNSTCSGLQSKLHAEGFGCLLEPGYPRRRTKNGKLQIIHEGPRRNTKNGKNITDPRKGADCWRGRLRTAPLRDDAAERQLSHIGSHSPEVSVI